MSHHVPLGGSQHASLSPAVFHHHVVVPVLHEHLSDVFDDDLLFLAVDNDGQRVFYGDALVMTVSRRMS